MTFVLLILGGIAVIVASIIVDAVQKPQATCPKDGNSLAPPLALGGFALLCVAMLSAPPHF